MKLWILRPANDLEKGDNPWFPWYDKTFEFVVRAKTELQARVIAQDNGAYENRRESCGKLSPWRNEKYSTCTVLTAKGDAGVVIRNHHSS